MRFLRTCTLALAVSACTAGVIWETNRQLAKYPPPEHTNLEARAANALVHYHSIVFPSRISEPELRWSTADLLSDSPELVLFGSSHGLQISSAHFAPHRLMNFSISGAMLADHLISTSILTRREKRPRVWLVMVDAWLFNPDVDFQTWRTRPDEIAQMERTLSALRAPPLTPIFGPRVDYFLNRRRRPQYSLDPLLHSFDRFVSQHFDDVVISDGGFQATLMMPDGALQPSSDKQQITSGDVRSLALRQYAYSADRHRYGNYSRMDEDLWHLFERWIQFLQQNGERVYFILSPYHPIIYKQIIAHPQNQLRNIEARLRECSVSLSARVVGSYDPAIVNVGEDDFYDGDHLRESGLRQLLEPAIPEILNGL